MCMLFGVVVVVGVVGVAGYDDPKAGMFAITLSAVALTHLQPRSGPPIGSVITLRDPS